jgi:hypothetical protein
LADEVIIDAVLLLVGEVVGELLDGVVLLLPLPVSTVGLALGSDV